MVKVRFNSEETSVISSALVEAGIDFPTEYVIDNAFPVELLSCIKKVVLINNTLDNLNFLTLLPNLEELVISNLDYQRVEYLYYKEKDFNVKKNNV